MRLSSHSDYALRILIRLAVTPDAVVPTPDIARAYGISYHHLNKIVTELAGLGYVEVHRGRNGGARLAVDPGAINIGAVLRTVETMELVECFEPTTNECVIAPACGLKGVLAEAAEAFFATLDQYTLADVLHRRLNAIKRLMHP